MVRGYLSVDGLLRATCQQWVAMGASAVSTDESGISTGTADVYPEADLQRLQNAVTVLLSGVGEDINREGLRDTPKACQVHCYKSKNPLAGKAC